MRQAHATTASESPASATNEVGHATSAEPPAKPARRKKKGARKPLRKPTARKGKTPFSNKPRPRGQTAAKVAKLLAKGMEPPAIAKRLGLSDVTVYYHRQRLNEQRSESRDLVPAKTRAVVSAAETSPAEVLDDVETMRRPKKFPSLAVSLLLEAGSLAYEKCWRTQQRMSRAERKALDAIDALMGGDD